MSLINNIIQWIIPENVVNDAEKYRKSRFTAISIVFSIILGIVYLIIDILIGYWIGAYSIAAFIVLSIFIMAFYRKYESAFWISNFFSFSLLSILFIIVFSTGGLYSPVVGWVFAAVISFFWYINKVAGYFWGVVCFVALFVLYFLTINGYDFSLGYEDQYHSFYTLFSHLGLFLYLITIFSLFEIEHRSETRQLSLTTDIVLQKNQELEVQRGITEEKSNLLKQAYVKLEQRKDHFYRKLTENGSEVLGIVDRNGIMKFVSSTIEKEFGYTPSEILNQSGFKYIHPADLEKVYEGFQEVLDTPNTQLTATYRYQHKNGNWCYVENFVKNLLDDKDIGGIVINFRNINAYILNQQKISEKERYYRSLIENSSDIISIVDIDGKYQYLSPSFEKQFGHYAINFIGEDAFQYIHPEDVEEVKTIFDKLKKVPGWQLVVNKRYRTPDSTGTWRYLESAAHNLIEDPVIQGIVINTRIVDDKVSSQRKLANREKYYRSLIENSMDMITVRNENAVITYCSPSIRLILGYEEEELIGTTGLHLIHPSSVPLSEKNWQYLMDYPNEMIRVEQKIKNKEGDWVFIETRIINLLHIEGVRGVVTNFWDITQRKDAERIQKEYEQTLEKEVAGKTLQLKEQNRALEATLNRLKNTQVQLVNAEKMASLGQLTAGIAHEINNPINFVSANIFPLKTDFQDIKTILNKYQAIVNSEDKPKATKEAEEYAKKMDLEYLFEEMEALIDGIEEGANRTKEIVLGLRNFSRLDEDTIKSADIHSGIEATLIILKNETKQNLTIERNYDDSIKEIECYPGKLNQVFMNLLSNAIQAIEGVGTITITTEDSNEHVKIKIKDTGVGMTESVKEKIFEPFFTTKDVGEGTGLGLSITYGIIEDHKGQIFVNSELGKGSEFVIVLPKVLM